MLVCILEKETGNVNMEDKYWGREGGKGMKGREEGRKGKVWRGKQNAGKGLLSILREGKE